MTADHHLGPGLTVTPVVEVEHWPFPTVEQLPGLAGRPGVPAVLDYRIATYLVRTDGVTVLVDAGNGNGKHRPVLTAHDSFDTDFPQRLAGLVPADEVDLVVVTHLHPDHAGGLTRLDGSEWVPAFPRARHLLVREERRWLEDLSPSGSSDVVADLVRTREDSVQPVLRAGLVDEVELGDFTAGAGLEVAPGVLLRAAPGHTPGHLVVELGRGGPTAIVTGDVLHHPCQLADLSVAHAGDLDPAVAQVSRRAVLDRAREVDALLLPAHVAPGRIGADGGSWLSRDAVGDVGGN